MLLFSTSIYNKYNRLKSLIYQNALYFVSAGIKDPQICLITTRFTLLSTTNVVHEGYVSFVLFRPLVACLSPSPMTIS